MSKWYKNGEVNLHCLRQDRLQFVDFDSVPIVPVSVDHALQLQKLHGLI